MLSPTSQSHGDTLLVAIEQKRDIDCHSIVHPLSGGE